MTRGVNCTLLTLCKCRRSNGNTNQHSFFFFFTAKHMFRQGNKKAGPDWNRRSNGSQTLPNAENTRLLTAVSCKAFTTMIEETVQCYGKFTYNHIPSGCMSCGILLRYQWQSFWGIARERHKLLGRHDTIQRPPACEITM